MLQVPVYKGINLRYYDNFKSLCIQIKTTTLLLISSNNTLLQYIVLQSLMCILVLN